MKKKTIGMIGAVVAMIACVGLLAACGNNSNNTDTTTKPTEKPSTETTAPITEEDVLGKITSVSDSFVQLVIYTATGEVSDYVTLDISALSATEDTDYVYTASTSKYYKVVNGVQSDATREDLAADVMIAVTTDDKGVQQIFIYLTEDTTPDATEEPTVDTTTGAVA